MTTLVLLLALAGVPPHADCEPQFAPLETGFTSGASSTPFWRKEEAGAWDGDGWLGWTWTWKSDSLQPTRLIVRDRPKDFAHDEEHVTVQSIPEVAFAVRCVPGLRARSIRNIRVANHELHYSGPLGISLGTRRYELRLESAREDLTDARVILTDGRHTQVLYSADGFVDDPHFYIVWAGDLDGDEKLDLVVNLSRKYSVHPYRLLLSSTASGMQLVSDVAVFETLD